MATVEHCLYCFESLAAELEDRDPLSLSDVQKSYAAYLTSLSQPEETDPSPSASTSSAPKKIPALRRLANTSSPGSSSSTTSLGSGSSSSTSLSSSNTAATSLSSGSAGGALGQAAAAAAAAETGRGPPVTDPDARYPLFVTWDKLHAPSGEYHLRGCIGTFSGDAALSATLAEYAVVSALHDTRFSRVAARELPALRCSVTLLTGFEDCAGVDDWVVGEHGVRISFTWEGRRYGSTYLPSVAPEQGWDREQTMVSLMRKAGWEGRRSAWRDVAERSGMKVERYRGDKEEVEFAEFKAWRKWVDEHWEKEE